MYVRPMRGAVAQGGVKIYPYVRFIPLTSERFVSG